MTETKAEDIKKKLTQKKKKKQATPPSSFLSTGSTLLNLCISGKINHGYEKGKYYLLVGDSQSGKTFLSLTCLAEATINRNFDGYRFIFDNAEDGALMDVAKFFGRELAEKMEPPALDDFGEGEPQPHYSESIEEFYYHIDDALKEDRPFIYVIDSMDSLSSKAEATKFQEQKMAYRKGKKVAGSYGDGKAKINSAGIRKLLPRLKASGSILIIISQTRDNVGFGFETKTRSGGRALRFYATVEIWSSCGTKIKKIVKGKPRVIGINSILEVKKNRVTGKVRKVSVPIYYDLGFDDIGGCVGWLIDEEHWKLRGKKGAQKIHVEEFDFKGSPTALIRKIEDEEWENDLRAIVQDVWDEIENACESKRKRRYE